MSKIVLVSADQVIKLNARICTDTGEPVQVLKRGAVESALHSAFYPGCAPFVHGGIAEIAGALAFYLAKAHAFFNGNKRTAAMTAIVFMALNGFELVYPVDEVKGLNALADIIVAATTNQVTQDTLKNWFDSHKQPSK